MAGKIYLVGIGPGSREHMTGRALDALRECDTVVGYTTYLDLVKDIIEDKEIVSSGMMREVERAGESVELALAGKKVAVVSSGDPGIYAMASIVLEYLKEKGLPVEVEVIPGVTSANAASARLGSPLGHDFAVISLSDLLTPWDVIEKRLEAAASGDFVICLYNPKSKKRDWQLGRAVEIVLEHRGPETPAGIVRNASRKGESVEITTLERLKESDVDMRSTVIIGNSETFVFDGWMVTPRGYGSKYEIG
jgi:precorrin-3B C17-methyltransferase